MKIRKSFGIIPSLGYDYEEFSVEFFLMLIKWVHMGLVEDREREREKETGKKEVEGENDALGSR